MTRPKYKTYVLGDGKGYRPGVGTILPKLVRDQIRCCVCLNGASVTARGMLRKHPDLDGFPCTNRVADPDAPVDTTPLPESAFVDGNTAKRTNECIDCGKWVPGERTLCGRCGARRERTRKLR